MTIMQNTTIPSSIATESVMAAVRALGVECFHYEMFLWMSGEESAVDQAAQAIGSINIAELSFKDRVSVYEKAVQDHLDQTAKIRGYDNMISACSYVGYANQYQDECIALLQWRANVWSHCYDVMSGVAAGDPAPSVDALISSLPVLQ